MILHYDNGNTKSFSELNDYPGNWREVNQLTQKLKALVIRECLYSKCDVINLDETREWKRVFELYKSFEVKES